MNFISKKISNETLGEKLKKAREQKSIDLLKAETLTGIQSKYLIALETNNYCEIPGEVYLKNFLKTYADALNLNQEEVLNLYEKEQKIFDKVVQNVFPKIKNKPR